MRSYVIYICLLIALVTGSCTTMKDPEIAAALEMAGPNAAQLQKVIDYYGKSAGDSLKLKAALFLIRNMPGKGFESYHLFNSEGKQIPFDLLQYKTLAALDNAIRSKAEELHTKLEFVRSGWVSDITNIKGADLIENIEYAFKVRNLPWNQHLDFEAFCEEILPYRVAKEPMQTWRREFYENFKWLIDGIKDSCHALNACTLLNDTLSKKFRYLHDALNFYPGQLTVNEVNQFGGGRCEDLNMMAAYCMRAIGLPISQEFTPFWANSNYGGHSWLSVQLENEKHIPFNPVYDNPDTAKLPFKGAVLIKAYRAQFKTLSEPQDITAEYIKTRDIHCKVPSGEDSLYYLGVMNGQFWKPVQQAKVINGSVTFQNVGINTVCSLLRLKNEQYLSSGDPMIVSLDGVKPLIPAHKQTDTVIFNLSDGYWLRPDDECCIIYWNNGEWHFAGNKVEYREAPRELKKQQLKKLLLFENIPVNALLRVVNIKGQISETEYGRPFIWDASSQSTLFY